MKLPKPSSALLFKFLAVALALCVWEITALVLSDELILVSPVRVLVRLFTIWGEEGILLSVLYSFLRIVGGFFLALLTGGVFALLAGRFPLIETLLFPYMAVVKAVPVVSFIVLAYVWMPSRHIPILISFLIVLPTVYTSLLAGIKARDQKLEEMADLFGVSPLRRFLLVRLPRLEPHILSAVSLGAGLAWKSGIAAEVMTVPDASIGEWMYYASLWMQNADLFALTVILVLLSVLFEKSMVALLKFSFRRLWQI